MVSKTIRLLVKNSIGELEINEWQWKIVESIKSESEMNAFILVLQALGKNPIKEIK